MSPYAQDLLNQFERMRQDFDRLLGGHRPADWRRPFSRYSFLPGRAARAYPLLNVSEDAENVYVDGLAPGVDADTFEVSVANNQLTVAGEKRSLPEGVEDVSIHRNERSAGRFVRTVTLPNEVDNNRISARYDNGVLRITLPKAEAAKPKQIPVSVS